MTDAGTPPSSARKRILVLSYSQTGQLDDIVASLLAPLRDDPQIAVHVEVLQPQPRFPFPWGFFSFLDAFPESAHLAPPPLAPLNLRGDEDFDLVILPWQVWYLAPSQPITAFLKHPLARQLLAGKPVVSVVACRNMWLLAFEKIKVLLDDCGARLIDHVALVDRAHTMATLVTAPLWLLSGQRQLLRCLPPAGVSAQDTTRCARFGRALRDALHDDLERGDAPLLSGLQAVEADPGLLFSERAATRSFFVWGKLLRAAGQPGSWQRKPLLLLYLVFLVVIVFTVVPLSLLVQALLRPLLRARHARLKQVFEQPSGSGSERLAQYE